MLKAAQAYFQTQVTTTSQGHLLLLLYDGAIKFLKLSKEKIDEKNYAEKGILISKAMDVLNELDSSLNSHKGGDLATNLHNLYFFCNTRLLKANMNMDTSLIDEVIKILAGLRDAFAQIMKPGGADQTAQPLAAGKQQPASQPVAAAPTAPATPAAVLPRTETPQPTRESLAYEPVFMPRPALRPPGAAPAMRQAPTTAPARRPGPPPSLIVAASATPAVSTPGPAPAAVAPPASAESVPPKPMHGKLLAGANFYRKMASQT